VNASFLSKGWSPPAEPVIMLNFNPIFPPLFDKMPGSSLKICCGKGMLLPSYFLFHRCGYGQSFFDPAGTRVSSGAFA